MNRSLTLILLLLVSFNAAARDTEKRRTVSLNGIWQIAEGRMNSIPEVYDHSVRVPGLVSSAVPEFRDAGPRVKDRRSIPQKDTLREAFWYRRTFKVGAPIPEIAVLKISKAMFGTKVFLNGKDLGEHLPCFTPGYFNLKDIIRPGENELIVRVGSCRNSIPRSVPDGFDFEKERYIPGIFDNVELILSGTPNIINAQAAPDIKNREVRVAVKLGNSGVQKASRVTITVEEAKTRKKAGEVISDVVLLPGVREENRIDVKIPVQNCRFWSPEDPFLYDLVIETEGDEYHTRFGMREFRYDTVSKITLLNGKPYYMRGSNITLYRFFEDEACKDLPWNSRWVRDLHRSFRQFHWNGLRYCIGIAPDEWYRIADEEGFMIQNEFPIWYGGKGWCVWPAELRSDELVKEYTEWMEESWNHPSIVIWDASNETVSNDGKTEEIADAVRIVRPLDLSDRPWDNSYSGVRSPGDVMELHPYHFSKSVFRLKDIAGSDINPGGPPGETKYMKIVNEYGWLWLNRDGSPTTLTSDLYKNLLGSGSAEGQRRELYAKYLAAETEFWRCHRQCAAVLHFTALAYSRSDGQTSDHFRDVAKLAYDPYFLKYMPDAFSPVGLMLDEWGSELKCSQSHDYRIIAINDTGTEWRGFLHLAIVGSDKKIAERSVEISIPSFGQISVTVASPGPDTPGTYTVIASLERKSEKPVKSIREIPYKQDHLSSR
jgi:beta-galactosidase